MYVSLSVMKASPGYADELADSMLRFAAAARTQPGLTLCTTLRDTGTGDLVGLAIWESEGAARAAGPALMAAVADDDFETWVADTTDYDLTEV